MSTATQVGDFPQTPGELYTRYYKPKSSLKTPVEPGKRKVKKKTAVPKVAFDTASEDETIHTVPVKKSFQNLLPAFSGAVFERPVSKVIEDNSKSVVMATNHNEVFRNPVVERTIGQLKSDREDKTSSKPVSRFKAQRQK
ncbi:hypothetical protein MAR_027781 [Mya arenaria]|uniref:Uncharacterized protein n=2 Tax=Mya arenaria TaxID=6604 RepID=A0ABY7F2Q1_MYAAR|nr:hypothetical protein MAR_027781 [Mya arenaria]